MAATTLESAVAARPSRLGEMISVLVVTEIQVFGEALVRALGQEAGVSPTGTAANSETAITSIQECCPDVVLVDVARSESLEVVRTISDARPDVRIVALAVAEVESDVIASAEAGAVGYVPRDGTLANLCAVIESVARGEILCPPRIAASLARRVTTLAAERRSPPHLTARETEIAQLLTNGLSNKEISAHLLIALPTVKNHVHSILYKLNARGRAEAVARLR